MTDEDVKHLATHFREVFQRIRAEMEKIVVGQSEVVENVLIAFFAEGHVLLEGVPGLGKTVLVRTLGEATGLHFSRIQFTPDLMPADVIGTNLIVEDASGKKRFEFQKGPVFCHLLLADEINRATPKTQSALLEAMQERQVTIGGRAHPMESPFLVLATQNPLEMEGTYPLPEAQLDRFLFKVKMDFPSAEELRTIIARTTGEKPPRIENVVGEDSVELGRLRHFIRQVPVAPDVEDEAIRIVLATHPDSSHGSAMAKRFVRYGASPRGVQALIIGAKIRALLNERFHVAKDDLHALAQPALRHRIILNFEGEAEGATSEDIIRDVLSASGRSF